jgi:hypothetical protein
MKYMHISVISKEQEKDNYLIVTYSGWILSTIPSRLPAPYLTAYKEKKTIKPFTNFVVLDEDRR